MAGTTQCLKIGKKSIAATVAIAMSFLASCGQKKTEPESDPIRRIFLHGDPEQLIAGTARNEQSFLNEENLKAFSGFTVSTGSVFSERSSFKASRAKAYGTGRLSLLDPNQDPNFLRREYKFESSEGSPHEFRYQSGDGSVIALRGVKEGTQQIRITHILETPVQILHYSLAKDGETMSFLGRSVSEETGKSLVSIAFTKVNKDGPGPRLTETPFNFLAGKGQLYAWNQDTITLTVCVPDGTADRLIPMAEEIKSSAMSLIERAWSSWVVRGKVGNRIVKLERSEKTPPPFSDVNTNCLVSVPTYARESSLSYLTTGVTLPATNVSKGSISAASVLIFEKAAISAPEERGYLGTVIHELGHFFGLGHDFDQDKNGQFLRKSAMAYLENRTFFPSETDLAALDVLYGKNIAEYGESPKDLVLGDDVTDPPSSKVSGLSLSQDRR